MVLKDEGTHDAGDANKASDGSTVRGANAGDAGKLFDGNTGSCS
ncbi:Variable outer membrane protein (plasmid) [Borrelia hermsii YBT]|uniref:Variable outer membrane protein n=1 Tax=Borrelia hermsii YBT TaxID=1313295 RepID=W5T1Q4_BORHE|nr:Variable outer membrane protein [Borrelia hermsii YBT]